LQAIQVWPNPFQHTLSVELPASWGSVRVELLSALGQPIHAQEVSQTSQLTLPNLPQGLYFLRVWSPQGPVTLRLMRL
jgi:hypothetical protein